MLFPTSPASPRHGSSDLLRTPKLFEQQIRKICEEIVKGARSGRATSASSEWLLENYPFLRNQAREIRESMPRGFYRRLPKQNGVPSIYRAAEQVLGEAAPRLDTDSLRSFFEDWQRHSVLMLSELWAIRPMLKLALLQRLMTALDSGQLESAAVEGEIRRVITALRGLSDVVWPELVESLSVIDRMLRDDPAGAYAAMDFETRDRYRQQVEKLARHSPLSEPEIAGLAVELARESSRHLGYFLIGNGTPELRRAGRSRRTPTMLAGDLVRATPLLVYLGSAVLVGAAMLAAMAWISKPLPIWFRLVLLIPVSQAALAVVNLLISRLVKPELLPRMDFSSGIPDDCRTFVVVPTLLLNKAGIVRLVENLEIYYLANRDRNLLFGLLTDFPDAPTKATGNDVLAEFCADRIRDLNRRYAEGSGGPFYLFHRDREWNESEGKWIGPERKRGKLEDFNRLLLAGTNPFTQIVGDVRRIGKVRYVITLDSDTQLPRDTAWKLAGTMAHPLNRPVFDERTGLVCSGYAILQPRIAISMESASRSNLAAIYSGQTGFDPYTKAVSDVYQDLFGRATFTGKGIYDLEAFTRATEGRFPDNTLLSHDLIEGEHARTGLVTDLEMIDDYPARYQAYSKRKHRWMRGDWQILYWLLPRVPDASWNWRANPLSLASRWKIFDNLRRSLTEPAWFVALVLAWFALQSSVRATTALLALALLPAYAELVISLLRPPPARFLRAWAWTRVSDLGRAHAEAVLMLIFLPAQATLALDAISRTLYRRFVSRRHLLEWESMAQAELGHLADRKSAALANPRHWIRSARSLTLPERCLAFSSLCGVVLWLIFARETGDSHPFRHHARSPQDRPHYYCHYDVWPRRDH